jgi:hypothetical protein
MKHLLTLAILASAATWAQDAPKLNARELFYTPPPNPAANANSTGGGRAGANTGSSTSTTSSNTTSTTTASTSTASNTTKKQTTAKNTTGGGRPATGTSGNTTASNTTAGNASGGTTSGTTSGATTGTSNPAAGNPDTVVAQVGQQTTGQTHMINTSVTNGPLGLRYAVLKRDASGAYQEVDPDTSFRTGDAIRLQVETNTTGYLYVVTQGTSGQWQLLFPRPEVAGGSNRVEPHIKVEVPGDKGVWKFDEHAGTEKLFVVLARQPEPDLDKLIYAIGNGGTGGGAKAAGSNDKGGREALLAQASIRDDVVSHLRDQMLSRDLVFEKVDEGTADSAPVKNEKAAYVVNISTAPDARVVKDFALQHR